MPAKAIKAKPKALNANELNFIDRLLLQEKQDATAAYEYVYGCTHESAAVNGSRMMQRPEVKAEIARRKKERNEALNLSPAELLQELRNVVTADPRELMEYRVGACRYCHGFEFGYQRKPSEYKADIEAYRLLHKTDDPMGLAFDAKGGIGFNPNKKPVKACPECHGNGAGYSYIKDSRTVSKAAARLYAGIKETAHGVEIRTRSVDKSVQLLMQNMGLLEPDPDKGKSTPADKAREIAALVAQAGATVGKPRA